jgi:hypothetical protein
MMDSKVILSGKDYKFLIAAVTRFPSVGSFAGSETINLQAADGKLAATTFNMVLSRARVAVEGELPLVGVNERTLAAFASVCSESAKVSITVSGKVISVRSRRREITTPILEGQKHKIPQLKDITGLKITKEIASRVVYLAEVAFTDSSRAELCCVMLASGGQAMACNQNSVGVLDISYKGGAIAIPISLAKILQAGDTLYVGARETVVRSGGAVYSMSSPVKAQKEFPIALVKQYGKMAREEVATVSGVKLAEVVAECNTCLGALARTAVRPRLSVAEDKLEVSGTNSGVKFRAVLPLLGKAAREQVFHVPLESMVHVAAFLGKRVVLAAGKHGELFLRLDRGWVLFPAWVESKHGG